MLRRASETALVLLALGAALVPVPPAIVERWFSTGVYPRIQQIVTPVANLVPFAWFDVILLTVTALVRAGRQARRERRWSPLFHGLRMLVVAAAGIYLVFLACWGLNY